MSQHRSSTADRGALHRSDDWFVEVNQRFDQASLWTFTGPRRVLEKILYVVAGAKRIARAMPEHDANLIVFGSVIEQIGQYYVHGGRHCVFSRRPIQLNPQDISGTLSNDVTHIIS
jgi:hypothetical protein